MTPEFSLIQPVEGDPGVCEDQDRGADDVGLNDGRPSMVNASRQADGRAPWRLRPKLP